jgi:hypothetical protein
MKVRALPTWRNPVGDGAKRTRGFKEESVSGISGRTFMVRGREKHRQANRNNDFARKSLILIILESGQCT